MRLRRIAIWALTLVVTGVLSTTPALADGGSGTDPKATVTAPSGKTDLSRLQEVLDLLQQTYRGGVDQQKLVDGAIRGALEALGDPYTDYFPPTSYTGFMSSLNGEVVGIGSEVERAGDFVRVTKPYDNSPALRAGLKPDDLILAVDGTTTKGMSLDAAVALIRGEAGTTVRLKIRRPAENREFEVQIVREKIHIVLVHTKMLTEQVGYLRLDQFSQDSPQLVSSALAELEKKGAKSWVFDLRNNPGGYLDAAWRLGGLFVPKGNPVVRVEEGQMEYQYSSSGTLVGMPVVVLVNENTASAAEIVAGAIQDYKAGPLVGVKTFGKGTVQSIYNLTAGAGMKVTIAEYLTGGGHHVHKIGITPDFVVEAYKPDTERTKEISISRSLQLQTVGLDVLQVQQHLAELGYTVGDESGYFGGALKFAVDKFQKDYGLKVTGMVDTSMVDTINQAMRQVLAARKSTAPDPQLEKALELAKGFAIAQEYRRP